MHHSPGKDCRKELELAARIARGDKAAFAQFVDLYGPRVQALARRYAINPADAEDLTQEIFLGLYRSIASFRGGSALSTWVYRVALNHCLKYGERRRLAGAPYDEALQAAPSGCDTDPAGRALAAELRARVDTAIAGLSPEHRDVVLLHELQELTYGECAEILRVPVGTVKSRLHYAFRALRGSLADYVLGKAAPRPPIRGEAELRADGPADGVAAEKIG